ncbi:MAG: MATE family efflux transporter [Oscillospiraceae bacterium]|nr:MATE family efflux transporter [Oscillospiraceae bacterium]
MNEKKKYTGVELMDSAPISTAIIRLALPMMLAMLAQSIYNMTDMYFIGQTGDPNMVAAIALANPLFMLSQALGNIFATGGSSYISRMLGAKRNDEAKHTATVSFYCAFCVGALLTIVLLSIKGPALRLIGASDATFKHTNDYFSVVCMFMAFAASGAVMSGQMRSEGAAKKAMLLQLIGIVLNIILDPIFILVFDWGTAGAAWATIAGQFVAFIYGVRYFLSKETTLSIKPADFKPNGQMMRQILSIGVPAGLSNIIMSGSQIIGNRILASYGDNVLAGSGVQMRVTSMFFMVIFALVQGYQPFAGYNYGARQFERLRKGFKLTLIYATVLCFAGSLVLRLFGASLIRFFIDDAATIEAGVAIMRIFVYGIPFVGLQVMMMVSFQAFGKPIQSTIITMGRQCLFYLPLIFLLSHFFGFDGFVWAQPSADMLTTGIAVLLGFPLFKLMRGDADSPPTVTQ